ncbi:MAG: DUF1080 domain-containing protein, partial [Planctomycetes bacterium]|nr:DUF1080 domain-containing protein [Planctomycetota bacterium]
QTNTKDIKDKPLQANVWYLVKMSVRGDKGECYFDGVKIFDFKADKHAAGAVGLSPLGSRYRFKNIRVTAPDGTVLLEGMPDLAAGAAPAADGFVSLFNGKDLTGWLPATMGPVKWRVENDAIVGPGNSYLSSARSDYKNFHLRLEARCTAAADSSSVWVRVSPAQEGYEIWVNSLLKTAGDLYVRNKKSSIPKGSGAKVPPGQWFTMEVIAVGERITVKVNGKTTTDFTDVGSGLRSGRIAIRGLSGAPEVRKIEIKELPAP